MDCMCPEPSALVTIVAEACGINLKQIQRIAFQRTQTEPSFTSVTILALATWQPLLVAVDDTKIVVTPLIGGDPIIEAGEAITTGGGDNSTLNGVTELEGVNPSAFSAVFKGLAPATEKAMKALMCEPRLTAYFFLQGGRIACVEITGTPAECVGFNVFSLFVSDRNNAGFGTKDTNTMSFSLEEGWSENLQVYKPSFNPLTDL